jgi:hypothetical protein
LVYGVLADYLPGVWRPTLSSANMESVMSVNSMGGSSGLDVSPYLTSALARMQSNGSAVSGSNSSNPSSATTSNAPQSGGGEPATETRVLSNQMIGALVAMQMDDDTSSIIPPNPAGSNSES